MLMTRPGLLLVILLSCVVVTESIGTKDFRFVHAVSTAGAVDVTIEGMVAFENVAFMGVTSDVHIIGKSREVRINVRPTGVSNVSLASLVLMLENANSWTLIFGRDKYGTPKFWAELSSRTCATASKTPGWSSLEFINLGGSEYPFVSVVTDARGVGNTGELFPRVNLNNLSGIVEIPSGPLTFRFVGPFIEGTRTPLSTTLSTSLSPTSNYVLVLWGGPSVSSPATVTEVSACRIPSFALPLPPPVKPLVMSMSIAQAVSYRSEVEWIDALNEHLRNRNGSLIDSYFERWASYPTFDAYFFPASVGFQHHTQTAAHLKVFLNTIPSWGPEGSVYSQGMPTVTVLNDATFVTSYTYYLSAGPFTRGVIHKTFTLQPDQKTVALTTYTHYTQILSPPIDLPTATNISNIYINAFLQSLDSSFAMTFSHFRKLFPDAPRELYYLYPSLPRYAVCIVSSADDPSYQDCYSDHFSAARAFDSLLSFTIPNPNALDDLDGDGEPDGPLQLVLSKVYGGVLTPSIQGIYIVNDDTFVLVWYLLTSKDLNGELFQSNSLQQVVFTRDLNGTFVVRHMSHQMGAIVKMGLETGSDVLAFTNSLANTNINSIQSIISANGGTLESVYASPSRFIGYIVNEFFVLDPPFSKDQESLEVVYRLDSWRALNYTVHNRGATTDWLNAFSFVFSQAYRLSPPDTPPSPELPYLGFITEIWSRVPTPLALSQHTFTLRVRSHQTPLRLISFGSCGNCHPHNHTFVNGSSCLITNTCGSGCECSYTCHAGTCQAPGPVPFGDSCATHKCIAGLTCGPDAKCH